MQVCARDECNKDSCGLSPLWLATWTVHSNIFTKNMIYFSAFSMEDNSKGLKYRFVNSKGLKNSNTLLLNNYGANELAVWCQ
jgi:hypothetical protein